MLGLVLPMLGLAASAQAQTLSDWTLKVKPGNAIFVTTLDGEEIKGNAGTAARGTLTVLTAAGPRVVAVADIQKVQKHDDSWTGAAIGGAAGLVMSLVEIANGTGDDPMVPQVLNNTLNAFATALTVSVCALVGWSIDALIKKRKTIYAGDASQPRSRASLVIKGRMVGVAVTFQ